MSEIEAPRVDVEEAAPGVLVARLRTGPLGLFERPLADGLREVVLRAQHDDAVRAVVVTGTHPERFVSHASIRWLQEGGRDSPRVGVRGASAVARLAGVVRRARPLAPFARRTPLRGVVELDRLHDTFLRMNSCGAIFVAALNGSALGAGAELAWACDLRLMADGAHFVGQPEILLGFNPGGGGTQRLTRLVGSHRSLLAILDGRPLAAREALAIGAVDELVAPAELVERAVVVAERYGARPKTAVAAVKRSVYLGGSTGLAGGLLRERAEFLAVLSGSDAQQRMLAYMRRTEADGELPLYDPDSYARALAAGTFGDATEPTVA
ncbi:enoyl-CoA hydratase/isomerase family protein [Conexibacter sp. JD483]|uniref:enoyl-CoA hydratase/isomerase family protein n=1 Tax=unclassified Conexibacter TaxID=2627773 RepID=UPI002722EA3F|nr:MULTISPECIES: enoyl-CoA hydratase/isomerase family protein [unclassified Conexibacter]MDO8188513.1 enoyl-CoA hydratase/isomerase family protein [Conexibacter sp. CPCC 205706]MDO8200143.1 enoyl-CoA hydratase/isomerase family protein [Conexibacter sp. CPCC 205762]MDR9371182.1 enoyl-CoA hydratase/isomerase family protein [Conexibacter sp. JD483]